LIVKLLEQLRYVYQEVIIGEAYTKSQGIAITFSDSLARINIPVTSSSEYIDDGL
jgi:hypothetical protein